MGSGASSERKKAGYGMSGAPPYHSGQTVLFDPARTGSSAWPRGRIRRDVLADPAAMRRVRRQRRVADPTVDEEPYAMSNEADPASLRVLRLVKECDKLPMDKADLQVQILHDCYPLLEQVPPPRFDHLAVLVYQKEGDLYYAMGDAESAKTTYSRAIQIAETRVARGEKEIYMVLKRYVLAMVGMSRLWFEQERDTTGFTLADKRIEEFPPVSDDDSVSSTVSREGSVLSDTSIFSLNRELLKSMAPQQPRRRAGPVVSVVKLLRPSRTKVSFSAEDDFVLRSQMTRELKSSPCELLLLRCIEVVELGHRRQSELLIPALIDLAQIYEHLQLYNRSLLLVRRCLGILGNVYDYDHPWIVQLRGRADYLMDLMDVKQRDVMATKIQATWKMHKAMVQLSDTLGRPVIRHVWNPHMQQAIAETDFLRNFVNGLPDGTVLYGASEADGLLQQHITDEARSVSNVQMDSYTPSEMGSLVENQNFQTEPEELPSPARPKTLVASKSGDLEYMTPGSHSLVDHDHINNFEDGDDDEPYIVDGPQVRKQTEISYTTVHPRGKPGAPKSYFSADAVGGAQAARPGRDAPETANGAVFIGRTTTVTRNVTRHPNFPPGPGERERERAEGALGPGPGAGAEAERSASMSFSTASYRPPASGDGGVPGAARDADKRVVLVNSRGSSEHMHLLMQRSTSAVSGTSDGIRHDSFAGSARSSVQSILESRRQVRSWLAGGKAKEEL